MTFELIYTDRAKQDLQRAADYIARDSPETAQRWFESFISALESLRMDAPIYGVAPESRDCTLEIRQLIHRTRSRRANRALYTIRETKVYILAIRRPGQDLLTSDELSQAVTELKE